MAQPEFAVSPAGHVARMLVLDAAAVEVTNKLRDARVESVLLKGPSVARWVYAEDEFRPYSDLDLLVAPGDLRRSLRVLSGLGFERVHSDAHAELLLRRPDQVTVDLHRLIVGVGVRPEEAFVDKGFRGQRYHPRAVAVYIAGRRNLTPQLRKLLKRRSAIEPVIGHTKHDHGMNRNYLLGKVGDRINALLSGCAWNLKKLWRHFVEHPRSVPAT